MGIILRILSFAFLASLALLPVQSEASVRLDVPLHFQEHSLSCEVATLKMALAAHDVDIPERELIANLPFDPTPKGAGVWGNPNKGFVGNIDGRMLVDGYGVYWDPIAQLGSQYATTTVIRHGSASDIARQLAAGNPVIVWGYYGPRAVYMWQAADGTPVKAVGGEHTRVVYGFDGTVDAPTRFYLIDPLDGYMSWPTDELMYNWSALNHMAVVVAPARTWVRVPGERQVWELDATQNSRAWVTNWEVFTLRGGSSAAVQPITQEKLLRFARTADIS